MRNIWHWHWHWHLACRAELELVWTVHALKTAESQLRRSPYHYTVLDPPPVFHRRWPPAAKKNCRSPSAVILKFQLFTDRRSLCVQLCMYVRVSNIEKNTQSQSDLYMDKLLCRSSQFVFSLSVFLCLCVFFLAFRSFCVRIFFSCKKKMRIFCLKFLLLSCCKDIKVCWRSS